MKKLLKQIDQLYDMIDSGMLTKVEAMRQLRELNYDNNERYDEGSNEHMNVYNSLIEVNTLITDTY
jgi:hypothetical protein